MSDLKANLKNLSKNPVFQMSLSAKELFHSNMLKMFLMQKVQAEIRFSLT